jgi:nucleoside-diphosphate-sugar epimerase
VCGIVYGFILSVPVRQGFGSGEDRFSSFCEFQKHDFPVSRFLFSVSLSSLLIVPPLMMMCELHSPNIILLLALFTFTAALQQPRPFALITGATGRTGKIVTELLLEQGFRVRIFCRDLQRARNEAAFSNGEENVNVEFFQGDLGCIEDIRAAFVDAGSGDNKLTHVVFMAGGEGADYRAVNSRGVAECAQQAVNCVSIRHFVVISSAWATRPYSIASLLFNSIYFDTLPMASHYLGEQALRRAAGNGPSRNLNYVILRAGGLNSDDRYVQKYPEAAEMGLTYQQGDTFEFLGIAGRPGMSRTQLAKAVVSAVDIEGRYTVELTGSGTVDPENASIYQQLVQDEDCDGNSAMDQSSILTIHKQAVMNLGYVVMTFSALAIASTLLFGWIQGLVLVFALNTFVLLIWSHFFANLQAC